MTRRSGLRVAVLAPCRYPIAEPFAGGLEAHVWLLSRSLRNRGHEVTLFAAAGTDRGIAQRHRAFATLGPVEPGSRRDISAEPALVAAEHRAYLSLMTHLTDGPERFDVIHNHSLHYLPVAMAHRTCAPMVSTLHTPPIRMIELAMRTTTGTHHSLAAVSRHTAESWSSAIGPVNIVPNGVDTEHWRPGPGGGPLIWFGRIVPEKGLDLAIEAARRSGRELEIAGPVGDPSYFEDTISPLLGPDVRYLGHLNQIDLARQVGRSCAALVTPRWDEPYGLVVAEALACGTPVAAFARGGIPEIVSPECARLAPADDVVALARCIDEAVTLSRAAARARALRQCSVTTMVERYEQMYRQVLQTRDVLSVTTT